MLLSASDLLFAVLTIPIGRGGVASVMAHVLMPMYHCQ